MFNEQSTIKKFEEISNWFFNFISFCDSFVFPRAGLTSSPPPSSVFPPDFRLFYENDIKNIAEEIFLRQQITPQTRLNN